MDIIEQARKILSKGEGEETWEKIKSLVTKVSNNKKTANHKDALLSYFKKHLEHWDGKTLNLDEEESASYLENGEEFPFLTLVKSLTFTNHQMKKENLQVIEDLGLTAVKWVGVTTNLLASFKLPKHCTSVSFVKTDSDWKFLKKWEHIKSLSFENAGLKDFGPKSYFKELSQLEFINCSVGISKYGSSRFPKALQSPTLTHLSFRDCHIDELEGFGSKFKNLSHLTFKGCRGSYCSEGSFYGLSGMLPESAQLEYLNIEGSHLWELESRKFSGVYTDLLEKQKVYSNKKEIDKLKKAMESTLKKKISSVKRQLKDLEKKPSFDKWDDLEWEFVAQYREDYGQRFESAME